MAMMANPMDALRGLQQAVTAGDQLVSFQEIGEGYRMQYDEPNGGKRFSYAKIINREVHALAIFGLVDPIDNLPCYSVGYAVKETERGRGLAVEAFNRGINEMTIGFSLTPMRSFYIEAVIDQSYSHSLSVARKLFPGPGLAMNDYPSGKPSLFFKRLIVIR